MKTSQNIILTLWLQYSSTKESLPSNVTAAVAWEPISMEARVVTSSWLGADSSFTLVLPLLI